MSGILPIENMALSVALAQIDRGEDVTPNTAIVCVWALARLAGRDLDHNVLAALGAIDTP